MVWTVYSYFKSQADTTQSLCDVDKLRLTTEVYCNMWVTTVGDKRIRGQRKKICNMFQRTDRSSTMVTNIMMITERNRSPKRLILIYNNTTIKIWISYRAGIVIYFQNCLCFCKHTVTPHIFINHLKGQTSQQYFKNRFAHLIKCKKKNRRYYYQSFFVEKCQCFVVLWKKKAVRTHCLRAGKVKMPRSLFE
jgi:hypothetical protein